MRKINLRNSSMRRTFILFESLFRDFDLCCPKVGLKMMFDVANCNDTYFPINAYRWVQWSWGMDCSIYFPKTWTHRKHNGNRRRRWRNIFYDQDITYHHIHALYRLLIMWLLIKPWCGGLNSLTWCQPLQAKLAKMMSSTGRWLYNNNKNHYF